jgi:hypothetical protein
MKEWRVWLSVSCSDMEEWKEINKIARKVDNNEAGAGTGFGQRDIDWYKPTKKEATKLKNNLILAFKSKGFDPRVTVFKSDEEE